MPPTCYRSTFYMFFLLLLLISLSTLFFFFTDTATTEIYTLSLHDALPISLRAGRTKTGMACARNGNAADCVGRLAQDRKSTRLNSSHQIISYAVFCLKKKKKNIINIR